MSNVGWRWLPLWIAVATATAGIGCGPSQEELDAERAKVRDLQAQLQEAQKERQALQDRLQNLKSQNEELSNRLATLGQDLEKLQGDRQSLKQALDKTKKALEQLRERERRARERLQTFRDLLAKFRSMIESGQLRVKIVRNRMVVELPEGILFASAKARLKDEGEAALAQVAPILRGIEGREFQIAGHTDNEPIRTRRYPSNWELSTARAVAVTRFLIAQGMPADRLSAAGYADTEPVASNDTEAGRQQNRRIEIVLVPALEELPDLSALQEELED